MTVGVLIVGAGHAGGAFAAALRQAGYEGSVLMVGAEPLLPYQRPPLSKAWLKGEASSDDLLLRPASFYEDKSIGVRLSTRVTGIDAAARMVQVDSGESITYEHLVLATGSRLRALPVPGANSRGVLELRTAADAEAIKARLGPGVKLAVVGGGYIGLEVAASARLLGAEVTVIEREARLLARVASEPLSAFFERCHGSHGVQLLLGASVAGFTEAQGQLTGLRLADGRELSCDTAVVGIGALGEDALAASIGLTCCDGVVVDELCRTSDPHIHAIGDCTRRPVPRYGLRDIRLESVPNALEQARQAAADLCGKPPVRSEVPWFWSDQYDVRLQIVGLPVNVAQRVIRGDTVAGRFAVYHLDAGSRLQCVEAVNCPAEFVAARAWTGASRVLDPARIADTSLAVKDIPVTA